MNECRFSIVIPLFNREREIARALTSCLRDMDQDFEVIIIDDASSDGSVAAVQPFLTDSRITLVLNETNRGDCGARAVGISCARGEWIICLDSDDEFLPGGLSLIKAAVQEHGASFDRLGFEYLYDTGGKSPLPAVPYPTELDFPGYLQWYSDVRRGDALWVTRRETFKEVPSPAARSGCLLYAFAFNSTYRTVLLPITVGAVHTDSINRLSSTTSTYNIAERKKSYERYIECDTLLSKYGPYMLRVSPRAHRRLSRNRVFSSILACRRLIAAKALLFHAQYHFSAEIVSLSLLILAGPRITQFLDSYRRQRLLQRDALASA